MTPQEAAAQLDGREIGDELPDGFRALLRTDRLIAIFGYSDDVMVVEGFDDDECGSEAYFTPDGLLKSECEDDNCPYFAREKANAQLVTALFDSGNGFSWQFETEIPHAKFIIKEDGENFCEGIVFALADVKPAA